MIRGYYSIEIGGGLMQFVPKGIDPGYSSSAVNVRRFLDYSARHSYCLANEAIPVTRKQLKTLGFDFKKLDN